MRINKSSLESVLVTQLCPTPWTVAHQSPLFMGFPRQECWSEMPFPSPGDLPNPGLKLHLLHWQADSFPLSQQGSHTWGQDSTDDLGVADTIQPVTGERF